jgi:hypothetical protein
MKTRVLTLWYHRYLIWDGILLSHMVSICVGHLPIAWFVIDLLDSCGRDRRGDSRVWFKARLGV